ncbi:MAG: hypothetical protein HUJ68_13045 [Clostridia bacterium]|nr:hypothetical protein [Clostridia bacterium]
MINPEYNIYDDTEYVPEDEGIYGDYSKNIEILPKKNSPQGVTIYEKGSVVSHIVGKSQSDSLTVYKEDGTVYIDLDENKIKPKLEAGEGIIIGENVSEEGETKTKISLDKEYIRQMITKSTIRGRNGIVVSDDEEAIWVEIDDHYIDDGHSWDDPEYSDGNY